MSLTCWTSICFRLSPSGFPSSNGFSGGGGGSAFNSLQQQQQRGGINGFESAMSSGGVFESGRGGGGGGGGGGNVAFDRSMSTANGFIGNNDAFGRGGGGGGCGGGGSGGGGGYDRQMSAPNLRDQFGMGGGGGGGFRNLSSPVNDNRGGDFGGGGSRGGFFVGERRSPPMYGKNDAGGMQIGSWNPATSFSGGGAGGGGGYGGGGGGGGGGMNFEIGTFNMGDGGTGGGSGGGGGGNHFSSSSSAYQSQSGHNIQGGPGIRETGIIEKLLVSRLDTWKAENETRGNSERYFFFLSFFQIFDNTCHTTRVAKTRDAPSFSV